jgi:hypothetical protein
MNVATSFGIRIRNTLTGCSVDLPNVLLYNPSDTTCHAALTLSPSTLTAATNGSPYTATFVATGGAGAPFTYVIAGGTLPPGAPAFALNPATGVLTGTPNTPGTYVFTVQVTDAATNSVSNTYSFVVN